MMWLAAIFITATLVSNGTHAFVKGKYISCESW